MSDSREETLRQERFPRCDYVRILGPANVQRVKVGHIYPVKRWVGSIPVIDVGGKTIEGRVPGGNEIVTHPLWEPAPDPDPQYKKEKPKKRPSFLNIVWAVVGVLMIGTFGSAMLSGTLHLMKDSERVTPSKDVALDESIDKYLDGDLSFGGIVDEFPSSKDRMHPLLYARATFACNSSIRKASNPEFAQKYKDQVRDAWIGHYSSYVPVFTAIRNAWIGLCLILGVLFISQMVKCANDVSVNDDSSLSYWN